MRFPSAIQHFDESLFRMINRNWSNQFSDAFFVPVRGELIWVPLYIIIAACILYFFRAKGIYLILLLGLNFACSDQLSSAVVKPLFSRVRPCNDDTFKNEVILRLDACGHGKSFTSSHAANTFAFAAMLSLLFRKKWRWVPLAAFLWAAMISYAQIYVGVHYPTDVIGGALLGISISLILYAFAKKYLFKRIQFVV